MLRLAARVRACGPQVIGHLHYLWWWALDYAPDGDLSRFAAQEIAAAAEWNGDPDLWLAALGETGWIDPDGHLHNWHDYAGKLAEARARDRERKRVERIRARAQDRSPPTSDGCPVDVRRTSTGCPALHNTTQQKRTKEKEVERETARAVPDDFCSTGPPEGFPPTAEAAAQSAPGLGGSPKLATKLWHLAASRGWRDAKGIPLRNWASYLAASQAFAEEAVRRRRGPEPNGHSVPRGPEGLETKETIRAPRL